jgi:glutathione S-transferase
MAAPARKVLLLRHESRLWLLALSSRPYPPLLNPFPVREPFPKQAHRSPSCEIPTLAGVYAPKRPSLSGCCHILLYYGLGSTDLPSFPSGEAALKALVDERTAIACFGKSPFVRTRHGLRYFLSNDPIFFSDVGEAHRDQCLATFAALNLPLDTPITLEGRSYTIADLLAESVAKFSFDQKELAWSVIAYAKYLPPQKEWASCFGERMSFSQLVEELIGRDLDKESCAGTHILQALVQIDNVDRKYSVVDYKARKRLDSYLTTALYDMVRRQREDGSWDWEWSGSIHDTNPSTPFQKKFLVTGHLLEVLLAVDSRRRPPDAVYVRAAEWLQRSLSSTEIRRDGTFICPFTHAARAVRDVVSSPVE